MYSKVFNIDIINYICIYIYIYIFTRSKTGFEPLGFEPLGFEPLGFEQGTGSSIFML